MTQETINQLVTQVQKKKDEVALSRLYNYYLPLIYGFMLKRLGSKHWAEDLTSQVFLAMIKNIEDFEFKSNFKNWLFGIAKNTLKSNWDLHYKMKTVPLEEFLHLTQEEEFIVDEKPELDIDPWEAERQKLPDILKLLPKHYAEVIKYRFQKELSLKETAQKMNISTNYVKVLQYRAIKKASQVCAKQIQEKPQTALPKQEQKVFINPQLQTANI